MEAVNYVQTNVESETVRPTPWPLEQDYGIRFGHGNTCKGNNGTEKYPFLFRAYPIPFAIRSESSLWC